MRLTLRTLLAYLDNTLEPADAEILRQKVTESGFATQLVQKIRERIADPGLPAPPPEAIGPLHDANVIGEYLDSTLPNEQVAEIERACLEMDANLAEAAACHQILTMVLGNKADVPPGLRERIYQLPDREVEKIAASRDRFSSISMDDTPSQHRIGPAFSSSPEQPDDLPTIESAQQAEDANTVQPVGINDSGVFNAPTRLRESGSTNPSEVSFSRPGSAIAGSRPRSKVDRIYGGSIRPSRITPWLVSLAIAGVLLFAIAQIFRPLLGKKGTGDLADSNIPSDVIVPPGQSPPMVELDPIGPDAIVSPGDLQPGDIQPRDGSLDSSIDIDDDRSSDPPAEVLPPPEPTRDEAEQDSLVMPAPSDEMAVADLPANDLPESDLDVDDFSEFESMAPPPPAVSEITVDPTSPTNPAEPMELEADSADPAATDTTIDTGSPPVPDGSKVVATVDGSKSLVVGLNTDGIWSRLGEAAEITVGTPVVCGPKFRCVMQTSFAPKTELIGPAGVRWLAIDEKTFGLEVEFGRLLITSKEPSATFSIKLGDRPMELFFADEETVVAASIKHFRSPGTDPIDSTEQVELVGILTVQGSVQIRQAGETTDLITGQQWIKRGDNSPKVSTFSSVPDWIVPPPPVEQSLDDSAREGLLGLIDKDEPIERALREATTFRRPEVAALAAQTLLSLGQADIYFGGDGILSEPKQRQYWPEHFKALVASLDRGSETAELLLQSIVKMDAANAKVLYRLLVGYSQKQLVEGGDEQLVRLLDSESMAVRVLALENLHQITGTTLYFRAETDNRIRRTPAVRKWMVRQQKGDIRWPANDQ
jgi:hypothetical protein